MPRYACDDCDAVFSSKSALKEHMEDVDHSDDTADDASILQRVQRISLHPRNIRKKLTLRNFGLAFGLLMMATLFAGTADFMSDTAPAQNQDQNQLGTSPETTPPTGASIGSAEDLPNVDQSDVPNNYVLESELSQDMQIHLLAGGGIGGQPAAILHYNCETDCQELVDNLGQVAQDFDGRVYVMPNSNIDDRIAMTAFRQQDQLDAFDRDSIETFLCGSVQPQPLACSL